MPNKWNTPATTYGYRGGSQAVGPVGGPKASLKPRPEAIAAPIRPISQPKLKLLSIFLTLWGWTIRIHDTRRNNAMATIQNCDVRMSSHPLAKAVSKRAGRGTTAKLE